MRHFSALDAAKACDPEITWLNLEGCVRIDPQAVTEVVRHIRTNRPGLVIVQTDDHVEFQLDALAVILREENAQHSFSLEGTQPAPPGLADVLQATDADVFLKVPGRHGDALFAAIGAAERGAVGLEIESNFPIHLFRHLRRTRHLSIRGLHALHESEASLLLDGNAFLRDLELPHLLELPAEAARIIGRAGLETLTLGPVLRTCPNADGWLESPGLVQIAGLRDLTIGEAARLRISAARCLCFHEPLDLSEGSAREISRFPRTLSLTEQNNIPAPMAWGLQGWTNRLMIQASRIDPDAAALLYSNQGELDLTIGIKDGPISEDAIVALARSGGRHDLVLSIFGSEQGYALSDVAAEALALRRSRVDLDVPSIGSLTAWRLAAGLGGRLAVREVRLTPSIAEYLNGHRGALSLCLFEMPGAREAELLGSHQGSSLTLQFMTDEMRLPAEVAMHLAEHQGELTLMGALDSIEEAGVRALEQRRGNLRLILDRRSAQMDAIVDRLEEAGALSPDKDPSVRPFFGI